MSSSNWVNSEQSNNSQVFGGCTRFLIFKSVFWSQNRKCVCQLLNIKCVCRSQNSHTSVIYICSWGFLCVACYLRRKKNQLISHTATIINLFSGGNFYRTLSKIAKTVLMKYFVTDRHFFVWPTDIWLFYCKPYISTKSCWM